MHQGFFTPVGEYFGPVVMSYILVGLDAERYPADLNTDAVAMYLKGRQSPDGSWAYPLSDTRPPICMDYIGQTALSMRALQLYAPKVDKAGYDQAIQQAAAWIAKAKSSNNDDRAWKVMGLAWGGKDPAAKQKALREYGLKLGTAFQLTDDLLDFTASEDVLGKAAGADLLGGKVTLPLILLLAENPGELLPTIRSRCALVRLGALPVEEIEMLLADRRHDVPPKQRTLIARLAQGAAGKALAFDLAAYSAARADALLLLRQAVAEPDHTALFKMTETYRAGAEGQQRHPARCEPVVHADSECTADHHQQ